MHELPLYDELSITEVSKAFKRYARGYKVEIVDHKDLLVQLEASKSSIKDLLEDLLNEMKGFKYQLTMKVLLSKEKENENIEYSSVYFNSTAKTMISSEFNLDKSFQEILYRIDNWINEGSGWIIESISGEYVNISKYSPLIGSSFVELPSELKNSKKAWINIKNNDNKYFLWCHVRHLNLIKKHLERIKKEDKRLANNLNSEGIDFPVSKNYYCRVEKQNNIRSNVFCYENKIIYPLYISGEKFSDCMDLLLIFDDNKSHYVYIKDSNRLMFHKTKNKNEKCFCKCCLLCFSSEKVLTEHRENCLITNGKQNVKLGKGLISFKNYSKQLAAPFKIYADFWCILRPNLSKRVNNSDKNVSYTEKYEDHIPCSFARKVVCVDNKFSKDVVLYREKNAAYKFIEAIHEEYNCCKKAMKKHFNKNLIMSAEEEEEEEEEKFQLSNSC